MTPISSQRYLSYFLHLVVAYFFIALVIVPKAYGAGVVLAAVGLLLFIFFAFRAREKCSLDYVEKLCNIATTKDNWI